MEQIPGATRNAFISVVPWNLLGTKKSPKRVLSDSVPASGECLRNLSSSSVCGRPKITFSSDFLLCLPPLFPPTLHFPSSFRPRLTLPLISQQTRERGSVREPPPQLTASKQLQRVQATRCVRCSKIYLFRCQSDSIFSSFGLLSLLHRHRAKLLHQKQRGYQRKEVGERKKVESLSPPLLPCRF